MRPSPDSSVASGRTKVFAYLTAEKADLYRLIMRTFIDASDRFAPSLRPQEVFDSIQWSVPDSTSVSEIEAALNQLTSWGNLEALPDTSDVRNLEDFTRQRYTFRISSQGEAAERILEQFQKRAEPVAGFQSRILREFRERLRHLGYLATLDDADPADVRHDFFLLRALMDGLAAHTRDYMNELQSRIDLQAAQSEQFSNETRAVLARVGPLVDELVEAADAIAGDIRQIEGSGLEKLLEAAALDERASAEEREATNTFLPAAALWVDWNRCRSWFISAPSSPSRVQSLRERARTSIATLTGLLANIDDRQVNRVDRTNDWRVLARWFATTPDEAEAHRMWRLLFGLNAARHLMVNDATLDAYESQHVLSDTSWLNAPPLSIAPPLRKFGSYSRAGRLSRIVDRSAEKRKLALAAREESLRIQNARRRFVAGRRMRLSELGALQTAEFEFLLDLIGESFSPDVFAGDGSELVSSDGTLRLRVEPTDDGRVAVIETEEGSLAGPDQWITVEDISAEVLS